MTHQTNSHLYVLLDRSGSMESMRTDVIGGFNNLLAEQQSEGLDSRVTLVQFDSEDPHEVIAAGVPVAEVCPLTAASFVPRGGTPLLDATGRIITMASTEELRSRQQNRPEVITVVTITDGMENQSREFSRADVLRLVKDKETRGWSFVFLGAGLDAYGEALGMGYDPRSVQAFTPDGTGALLAFGSVSRAMSTRRAKLRRGEHYESLDFFEGNKEAEQDRQSRHSQ